MTVKLSHNIEKGIQRKFGGRKLLVDSLSSQFGVIPVAYTAKHTFFDCCRWCIERNDLTKLIGKVSHATVVGHMLDCEGNSKVVENFIEAFFRR